MHPFTSRVQPQLPCPLLCYDLDTSKAKINELPEKYIGAIRATRPSLSTRPSAKWLERKHTLYNPACAGILNEDCDEHETCDTHF